VKVRLHAFLTSALEESEWSASHLEFTPEEKATSTHWIIGCMGPKAGLDVAVSRKIPAPARNETRFPAHRQSLH